MRRLSPVLLVACTSRLVAPPAPSLVTLPTASAAPPAAPEAPRPEPDPEPDAGEWVTPCKEGTDEHKAAATELASISKAIHDLPMTGDPKPIATRLASLVETKCFLGVGDELMIGEFQSALSLKTYWGEGGEASLSARLAWDKSGDRRFWLAPSIRHALTRESVPATHPLASLLCPAVPNGCGSETTGWAHRAELALHAHAEAKRGSASEPPKTQESCAKAAAAVVPSSRAFLTFRSCLQQTAIHEDALPLGRFRAPSSGWLVLRGRRGHHSWCEELRAYDLTTGSAHVASLCGGMFSAQGPIGIKVEKGKLPVDALREAAWMMLLANTADRDVVVSGSGIYIPKEIDIRLPAEQGFGIGLGSFGTSSGRTTLVYQWIVGGKSIASGTVEWPDAHDAADEHATNLLAIAELAMVKGCAPAAVPAIPWTARYDKATRVTRPEAYFPEYAEPQYGDLERELARAGTAVPCR
ncbi:MAG: hypothetical protein U0270_13910 [Labilithrix sp.]